MSQTNSNTQSTGKVSAKMTELKTKSAQKAKAQAQAQAKSQARATQAAVDKAVARAINNEALRPGRIPPGQWGYAQESLDGQVTTRQAQVFENGSMRLESVNEKVVSTKSLSDGSTEAMISRHTERYSIENNGWAISEQIWSNERALFKSDGTASVEVIDSRRTTNKGFASTQDKAQATAQWNSIVQGSRQNAEREL